MKKLQTFFNTYLQTIFLLLGCLLLVVGVGLFNFKLSVILAGVILIMLAFLINYEKN
jgi:ABC-type transport system involved in cytochrome bd biosynthesis fused ATPase/permease subunit